MSPTAFALAVWTLCGTNGSVTSWGRTVKHSLAVGGFATDPHTWWVGADIVWDVLPEIIAAQTDARVLGLQLLREKDHDHVQPLGWVNHPHG